MIVMGLWILRILVIMMVLRMIIRSVTGRRRPAPAARRPAPRAERPGGTLVRDPQCGTYIPEAKALTLGKGPAALHFCSAACRDKWAAIRHQS
ncbi:MAG: hypothetical protein ABI051_04970 [Vicinamibacterales bacterium]